MKIKMEQLNYIFRAVKHSISDGEEKPILQNMEFKNKDGFCTVQTIDGYRLSKIKFKSQDPKEYAFYIRPFTLPDASLQSDVKIIFYEKHGTVTFKFENMDIVVHNQCDDEYKDKFPTVPLESEIGNDPVFEIALDKKYLKEALDSMRDSKFVLLKFWKYNRAVEIWKGGSFMGFDKDIRMVLPIDLIELREKYGNV